MFNVTPHSGIHELGKEHHEHSNAYNLTKLTYNVIRSPKSFQWRGHAQRRVGSWKGRRVPLYPSLACVAIGEALRWGAQGVKLLGSFPRLLI